MPARPAAAPAGSWKSVCASVARTALPDCSTEQRVMLRGSANLFVLVRITVPAQSRRPTIFVQTPIGILLRPGVSLQLDARGPVKLDLQVCDQSGCYAGTPMSDDFLGAMLAAKTLTVKLQGVNGRIITAPVSLGGFRQSFDKIK
jgi:invasion protein IalB